MKTLITWLHRTVLSPLPEPASVLRAPLDPSADLDRPTYLRRGLAIAGLHAPAAPRR